MAAALARRIEVVLMPGSSGLDEVQALGAAEGRRQMLDRVAVPGRAPELLGRELLLERRVEVAHPARVAPGGRLAERLCRGGIEGFAALSLTVLFKVELLFPLGLLVEDDLRVVFLSD